MLKILLRKQMTEIFRTYFYDAKKNKKRSTASTVGFIILYVFLMVGVLGGIFTFLSLSICSPLADQGLSWLYFALMGLIAILLGAFGSVFNTFSGLYLAKDNDLLLSMPIPTKYIVFSRLLSVYLMGAMYCATVMIPAVIVYWLCANASIAAVIGSIIMLIMVTLIVLILSCLLGWVVAKISAKLKNKSFITVIVSLVFITAYYVIYYKAQQLIEQLISSAAVYGEKIKAAAYPVYLFGQMGEGNLVAVTVVSAIIIALMLLTYFVLSKSFIKIATATAKTKKVVYKGEKSKQKSVFASLLGKEFKRFTSSANYMLNCGMGALFIVILGVAALIKGNAFVEVIQSIFGAESGAVLIIINTMLLMINSMNFTAAPSVSLEGKTIWILQSLPISPWQVIKAKLFVQILLSFVPTAVFAVCAAFIIGPIYSLITLLFATLYIIFFSSMCMLMGIKSPNLNWTNEIIPIKQGMATGISMLIGWLYSIIFVVIYAVIGYAIGSIAYMGIFALITILLCVLLYNWLKTKGTKIFAEL